METGKADGGAIPHLEWRLGLFNASTINMCNMVGSGTFVTLPWLLGEEASTKPALPEKR